MGKHLKDNIKFYIICAAFGISLLGNFTGFGADKNQIDTNKVNISEIKRDNKIEHAQILADIKRPGEKVAADSGHMQAVRAQNNLIISLIKKKL